MQLVEQGRLGLEDRVATHLPRFAANGKGEVTVRHLLTHVGGLPAVIDLCSAHPDVPSRLDAVLTVAPTAPPGTAYVYSDLGLITAPMIATWVRTRQPSFRNTTRHDAGGETVLTPGGKIPRAAHDAARGKYE